jgi:hypothetical protein
MAYAFVFSFHYLLNRSGTGLRTPRAARKFQATGWPGGAVRGHALHVEYVQVGVLLLQTLVPRTYCLKLGLQVFQSLPLPDPECPLGFAVLGLPPLPFGQFW